MSIRSYIKHVSLFFFIAFIIILIPNKKVFAGTYGDFHYYDTTDGTIVVDQYNGTDTEVTIPSTMNGKTVSQIVNAFKDNKTVTKIVIPNTVKSIFGFYGCTKLHDIEIPNSVIRIGDGTFQECDGLESIIIPDGVEIIGDSAFSGCDNLASIEISNSVTEIGTYAFNNCKKLTDVTLSTGIIEIKQGTFSQSGLQRIVIPNGVESIGLDAFYNCDDLEEVVFPESLKVIGNSCFTSCDKLKILDFSEGLEAIGEHAFNNCDSIQNLEFPDSLSRIDKYAFASCEKVKNISFPHSLTMIDEGVFSCDIGIEELVIPENITVIGEYAFNYGDMRTVALPKNLTTISANAFDCCGKLKEVYYSGTKEEWQAFLPKIKANNMYLKGAPFIYYAGYLTISYNALNGSEINEKHYNPGDNIRFLDSPIKDNYDFGGWFTEENGGGTQYTTSSTVYSNLILYAKWTGKPKTVTLEPENGESSAYVDYKYGDIFVIPETPERDGYDFKGWFTQQDGKGTQYTSATVITADITLYAKWTRKCYTVTYYPENGNSVSTVEFYHGDSFSAPEIQREGYTLVGWYVDTNDETTKYTDQDVIYSSLELHAKWDKNVYWVYLDGDNGEPVYRKAYYYGDLFTYSSIPINTGYDFGGWYTERDGKGTLYNSSSIITSEITLYAKWNCKQCHIILHPENGEPDFDCDFHYNDYFSLSDTPEYDGHYFNGWFTEQNGQGDEYNNYTKVQNNVSLYAYWVAVQSFIRVSVNLENGNNPIEYEIEKGSKIDLGQDPEREGYVFKGWYYLFEGEEIDFSLDDAIYEDIEIHARWEKEESNSSDPDPTEEVPETDPVDDVVIT